MVKKEINKMEMKEIPVVIALIGIIALLIGLGIGIYAGNNQGEINTKNLLQPQIDSIIQENSKLKFEKEQALEPLLEDEKLIKDIAIKCYWAMEFENDPIGTIEHWKGNDYTDYYVFRCRELATQNWEKIKSDE